LLNFNNIKSLNDYKNKINELCDKIEYFEIRNKNNLSNKITSKNYKIFIAYRINKIRLIDNV
jgi:pantothenate synthetase